MVEIEDKLTRCFICIQFPEEVIKEIARVQEELGKMKFTGKITEIENLHLTLKFLGEIDDKKLNEIKGRLKKIEFREFNAKLSESGTFSIHGNPRIVWIKIGGIGIFELQKKIDDALNGLFKKEERFMSHLTIARIKYAKDKKRFIDYAERLSVKKTNFKVNKFILMKSEPKSPCPIYSVIEEYALYGGI